MKTHYKSSSMVVHISPEDMKPIVSAVRLAKKSLHKLMHDIRIGDEPSPKSFDPEIPTGTTIGMMFIESEGRSENILFLVGGFSKEDMGIV